MSIVPTGRDPDRTKAIKLYSAFGASLILMVVPMTAAALVSVILLMIVLFMAGNMKRHAPENSLSYNHAVYVGRTVWIGSIIAVILLIPAAMYLLQGIDNGPLTSCMQNVDPATAQTDPEKLQSTLQPCMDSFVKLNLRLFIISALITMGPSMLYFFARFGRGLHRVLHGYRIAKPKAWF